MLIICFELYLNLAKRALTSQRASGTQARFEKLEKMDPDAAKESLDIVFHMSNILETALDRHTLSILIALCDMGLDAESLAAMVKELRSEFTASSSSASAA
ncbi:mitotic-spindle organizing protein 1A-like [Henckelia pumila]|uniref:mitotic-spindle organizing protein 1A-like n=1 Tax=Henckelia pumila TaxID=405737 RepID=UPI003C6E61BC